ncbi:toxin-antitoxin system YwqK family antitoxin [Fusobacterium simiae]|uniref:toxin-antitoxin system YwqK family antitoxin n=1 Tax=Fusobacterium TaxID=848 RepID=UPI0004113769|nr:MULTISPECIES: toxin-antitoxin system YwqK family antitoxin [Fusobacterium]MDC7954700.1 toxin-antitoxin system YwqK family antitoxin [Fusobacterium simiae]
MKKLLLGLLVLVSVLSFSAERKISDEQMIVEQEIIYAQGEKTPYTGIVEFKYENGKIQGIMGVQNGKLNGKGVTYYPSGKIQSKENYKNGVEDGINIIYYENGNVEYEKNVTDDGMTIYEKHYYPSGKLDFEATYKNRKLDGVVKKYGENGEVIQQATYKNGVQVK